MSNYFLLEARMAAIIMKNSMVGGQKSRRNEIKLSATPVGVRLKTDFFR
jgi:hypothetical protein